MAILVHETQTILSLCVSLLRRLLVPLDRLLVVHIHAMAIIVHETQIILSHCVSLLRRLLAPLDRLLVVYIHALALIVHDTQSTLSLYISLLCRPLPQPHHLVHLPLLPTTQRTPRSIAQRHAPLDLAVYRERVVKHLFRAIRQLRAAHRTRLLHTGFSQLLHARLVEAVRAVEDLRTTKLRIVEVLQADGALIVLVATLRCSAASATTATFFIFCRRRRRLLPFASFRCLCFGGFHFCYAPIRQRHAAFLVPAHLPVLLLASHAAVVRDLAPAAGLVHRTSGDGAL